MSVPAHGGFCSTVVTDPRPHLWWGSPFMPFIFHLPRFSLSVCVCVCVCVCVSTIEQWSVKGNLPGTTATDSEKGGMAFRSTLPALGSRAKGYENRVMVYAHRRHRARYLPPKLPHTQSPLANKSPEEYGNTWDPRTGVEWYYRVRRRGAYRHWPWVRWTDDPVRHHREAACNRTFSVASDGLNDGVPLWNYYAEVGQKYDTPNHFPLHYMAPFIYQYTAKVWSMQDIENHLKVVEERTGLRSIEAVQKAIPQLVEWGETEMGVVPHGLLQHVVMLAEEIVSYNKRVAFRKKAHEGGILRTSTMERYYAIPHLRTGPAMPTTLEVSPGEFPWGRYTHMLGGLRIHPLQRPDGFYKGNMYPA